MAVQISSCGQSLHGERDHAKTFNRYPLIIDPTGRPATFVLNEFKDKKIAVTSFLDESFLKVLESALCFGNPILIQHLDPILNAVLNKEIRHTGGSVLIRLSNQGIKFSPAFAMFLSTRDPSVEFLLTSAAVSHL